MDIIVYVAGRRARWTPLKSEKTALVMEAAVDGDSQGQVKVTGSPTEGHKVAECSVDTGDNTAAARDVRCKLALTDQELVAVKRHLAESRRENDDLLKAVAYLRSKLDTNTASTAVHDSTPSAGESATCWSRDSNHSATNSASAAANGDVDDDDEDALCQNATSDLDCRRLREELVTATQVRRQLERELTSTRRDMDAMLETLRRKERQFADERKQLEKKNKELSDVFDLFAERSSLAQRRHKCIAARKDQLHDAMMSCRTSDDVGTQTDDVSVTANTSNVICDDVDSQALRRRVEHLEQTQRGKDETIRRHAEMLERNDVIVAGMTRSVTSLEASLSASRDLLAVKERTLVAAMRDVESRTEECQRTQRSLDVNADRLRQLETRLVSAERSLSEKEREMEQSARHAGELTANNDDLRRTLITQASKLEQNKLQLNKNTKRLETELERKTRLAEELTAELEATRERAKKYEVERRKLECDVGQLGRDYRAVFQQLVAVSRGYSAVSMPVHAAQTLPPLVTGRKLFDVRVRHEKSSSSSNVSTASALQREQSSAQQCVSPALRRQRSTGSVSDDITAAASDTDGGTSTLSQQMTDDDSPCLHEVVGDVTSPVVEVCRRDRSTMSGAPATFRRSRSMSELDALQAAGTEHDVIVFHEQLVEPIQLTMFTPPLASTTVTPSPTIMAPPVTSSLPPSCDVTRRRLQRRVSGSEQGTLSASASRDHSPSQRYPPPPPNMIISPLHRRSLSADRSTASHYNSALQRLVKRLSDVMDVDDDVIKSGGHVMVTSSADSRHDNKAPPGGLEQHHTAACDVMMTSASVSHKAMSQTEIALSSLSSPSSAAASAGGAATHSRLSKWTATLALFRKKTRRTDSKPSTTGAAGRPSTTTITVSTRPLLQQCASLSSGDVTCASSQVHSNLSQSQPLHSTAATTASPPAVSASQPRTGSKLARIIDPLKLRRRPNSSSVDLQTTSTITGTADTSSHRPLTQLTSSSAGGTSGASRSVGRMTRLSLTSAYMQGSL